MESVDPETVNAESRAVVSGLVARALNATAGWEGDGRRTPARLGLDPVADAHLFAETLSEQQVGLVEFVPAVAGAALAMAVHHPCTGSSLGTAILAGCELSLRLAGMAGAGGNSRFRAPAATCAAVSAGRVLGLDGDRLVSAIGIGASSSVGAAVARDAAWQAGKSASNGVLAALLAGAGFTGPADAVEHPRGLLGAVFGVAAPAGVAGEPGSRIRVMESLVSPVVPDCDLLEDVAGLWEVESVSGLVAALLPQRRSR